MGAIIKDELFEAQMLRALGYTTYGGADVGECLATAARIKGTSLDEWHDEWFATASAVHVSAEASLAAGDLEGARGAFWRASNYFRTAAVMLMGAPLDPRLVEAHRREVAAFRKGADLMPAPPQQVAIPYEDRTLPAYFFRPSDDDQMRPTMVLTNGYDGTAEELYFASGAAALARGYNVLAFDGPGQGTLILDEGVVYRPDWENVVTPVIDRLLELPGVDPDRIVLMGLSFGGYLAPRAATGEHRIAACVSDCGPYDLFGVTAARLPGPLARALPDGNRHLLSLLNRVATVVMRKPTAGWALRRNLLVHGVDNPLEFFRLAPQYSLVGLESQITCPTFVATTDADDLSEQAPTLYAALTCPNKKFVKFKAADGAGDHCEGTARTRFHQEIFAWLDQVLPAAKTVTTAKEN